MTTIPGKPEGRAGIWLIDRKTARSLVRARKIHCHLGTGVQIGADWSKAEVLEHLGRRGLRFGLIFPPQPTFGHQLVTLNDEQRWAFDVGEIDETSMRVGKCARKPTRRGATK